MADLTSNLKRLNGVDSPTNSTVANWLEFDGADVSEGLAKASHIVADIPADHAISNITVVFLETGTSAGAATLDFGVKCGEGSLTSVLAAALSLAETAVGLVVSIPVQKVKTFQPVPAATADKDAFYELAANRNLVEFTVAVAAFTKLHFKMKIETIPLNYITV